MYVLNRRTCTFDGATTIQYEPSQTTHEFVAGLDKQTGTGEAMLRIRV